LSDNQFIIEYCHSERSEESIKAITNSNNHYCQSLTGFICLIINSLLSTVIPNEVRNPSKPSQILIIIIVKV